MKMKINKFNDDKKFIKTHNCSFIKLKSEKKYKYK